MDVELMTCGDKSPQCTRNLHLFARTRMLRSVSFAEYQNAIPASVRLIIALVLVVAVTVLLVHVFHNRILALNAPPPPKEKDDDPDPPPGVKDISGRLIALTTFGFVFLLGLGFSQFWSTAKDARDAVLNEGIDYQRVVGAAERLPADQRGLVLGALEEYRQGILTTEWPLMETANTDALATARYDSGERLLTSLNAAKSASDATDAVWVQFSDSLDDLLSDGIDRTNALPSPMAVSVIGLVAILGIANLIAITIFQPSRKKANLVLVASMAAITAFLLFALIEISNPYTGAGAVTSILMSR